MKSKIKVYCDNAVSPKWLKLFSNKGLVELFYVPYETRTRKLNQAEPSVVEYNQPGFTYNEPNVTYNSVPSDNYEIIRLIVGLDKKFSFDIRQLDAAYKNKCDCFITSDKEAFISKGKREKLEKMLSLKIFHQGEEDMFMQFYEISSLED